jgi:hypothetical protein
VGRIEEMTFTTSENPFKRLSNKDQHFYMNDGIRQVPRASIEVKQNIPYNYQMMIAECIDKGWLKPVAYVKIKELFWEVLEQ